MNPRTQTIPNDIWVVIFEKLSTKHMFYWKPLRLVCKDFRDIIDQNPSLIKNGTLLCLDDNVEYRSHHSPTWVFQEKHDGRIMHRIAKYVESALYWHLFHNDIFFESTFPRLKHLVLQDIMFSHHKTHYTDPVFFPFFQSLTSLVTCKFILKFPHAYDTLHLDIPWSSTLRLLTLKFMFTYNPRAPFPKICFPSLCFDRDRAKYHVSMVFHGFENYCDQLLHTLTTNDFHHRVIHFRGSVFFNLIRVGICNYLRRMLMFPNLRTTSISTMHNPHNLQYIEHNRSLSLEQLVDFNIAFINDMFLVEHNHDERERNPDYHFLDTFSTYANHLTAFNFVEFDILHLLSILILVPLPALRNLAVMLRSNYSRNEEFLVIVYLLTFHFTQLHSIGLSLEKGYYLENLPFWSLHSFQIKYKSIVQEMYTLFGATDNGILVHKENPLIQAPLHPYLTTCRIDIRTHSSTVIPTVSPILAKLLESSPNMHIFEFFHMVFDDFKRNLFHIFPQTLHVLTLHNLELDGSINFRKLPNVEFLSLFCSQRLSITAFPRNLLNLELVFDNRYKDSAKVWHLIQTLKKLEQLKLRMRNYPSNMDIMLKDGKKSKTRAICPPLPLFGVSGDLLDYCVRQHLCVLEIIGFLVPLSHRATIYHLWPQLFCNEFKSYDQLCYAKHTDSRLFIDSLCVVIPRAKPLSRTKQTSRPETIFITVSNVEKDFLPIFRHGCNLPSCPHFQFSVRKPCEKE